MKTKYQKKIREKTKELEQYIKDNWDKDCWGSKEDLYNSLFFTLEDMVEIFSKGLTQRKLKEKERKKDD